MTGLDIQRLEDLKDWHERRADAAQVACTKAMNALADAECAPDEHMRAQEFQDAFARAQKAHRNLCIIIRLMLESRAALAAAQERFDREESARKAAEPQRVPAGAVFVPEGDDQARSRSLVSPDGARGKAN
jgi:hypothetical protein